MAKTDKNNESNTEKKKTEETPKEFTPKPEEIQKEQPKIKHDWYQTETTVVVEVRIKGLDKDQLTVEFQPRELSVSALIPQRNNTEYNLEIDLAHEIQPERCTFKVLSTKLEIKMLKKDGFRWTVLEGDDPLPVPVATIKTGNDQQSSASGATTPKNPYSSKNDWTKIEKDMEKN